MANDTKFVQTSAPIPPPPGGGSWRWDGKQWQARTDLDATPAIEALAAAPSVDASTTPATETRNTD